MKFSAIGLEPAGLIEPERLVDERGFFARAFCRREFEAVGLHGDFVQANIGFNVASGTLRGLHYQAAPHQEVKLVRCTRGAVWDVIVDLRPESPTHRQWFGVELSEDNYRMLYVPQGFAHGYQALTDNAEIVYHTSAFYVPDAPRGVRFDDPTFGIRWPREVTLISTRDRTWPDYAA